MDHAVGFAGGHQGIVQLGHLVDGVVDLPAQFTDVADPEGGARYAGHGDLLAGQPRPRLVGQVSVGAGAEDVTGPGAGDGQDPHLVGPVLDGDVLGGQHVLFQPVPIVCGAGNGRVEVEPVAVHAGDGHLALDPAQLGEHVDEADSPLSHREPVG